MKETIPAISIIIPMYNVEKYIGECLDSLLCQTLQDFEVIVVDDCSTDNSREVVESYRPKFNGKLRLIESEKNFGSAAVPRNIGIDFSHGKYLLFVDSDDAITPTALEELFQIAEEHKADILHCGKFLEAGEKDSFLNYEKLKSSVEIKSIFCVDKPVVFGNNLSERISSFGRSNFRTTPWNYLFRRDFICKNQIKFPKLLHGEDEVFDFFAIFMAKKIVLIPNIFYIYRKRGDSVLRKQKSVESHIREWFGSTFKAIEIYENFMNEFTIFKENPQLKYLIIEHFVNLNVASNMMPVYSKIPSWEIDGLIRKELENIGNKIPLTAFLFNKMNIHHVNLMQQGAMIRQMNAHIQKQNQIIKQKQEEIDELQRRLEEKI